MVGASHRRGEAPDLGRGAARGARRGGTLARGGAPRACSPGGGGDGGAAVRLARDPDPKEGFLIHGRAENAIEVTLENRVSLAPLRFGAGIKGKLLEAMVAGTPSITTSIGAEGMASPDEWPGSVVDDPDLFAEAASSVYTDEVLWNQSQLKGYTVLENHFESDGFFKRFEMKLSAMESRLDEFRSAYFIQQLVKHQSIMSNRYLSKWIEQKNKA